MPRLAATQLFRRQGAALCMSAKLFYIIGFYYLKVLSIIILGLCITRMHRGATHKVLKTERIKLGELHIKLKICKTPKVMEG
jgi:hypothetical protein